MTLNVTYTSLVLQWGHVYSCFIFHLIIILFYLSISVFKKKRRLILIYIVKEEKKNAINLIKTTNKYRHMNLYFLLFLRSYISSIYTNSILERKFNCFLLLLLGFKINSYLFYYKHFFSFITSKYFLLLLL